MGSSAVKGLCGKNFGYFPETADSPNNSDDEDEDRDEEAEKYMPKGHRDAMREANKGKFLQKLKAPVAPQSGWGPYTMQVEVKGVRRKGIRAYKARISGPLLEKLKTVGSLHTLELVHCKLKDLPPIQHIDDLTVLQLSENSIRTISLSDTEGASKASKLEKFICDRNQVEVIATGVFSGEMVANLLAINLARNNIPFLPRDFGHKANSLLYLDLSYNKLTELPSDLMTSCRKLQGLYVQRNELRSLPPDIGLLKDLRKLFLSHNKLREVPDSVGDCGRLEKVRLISNEIRLLPDSFIKLWKKKGGRLEELLVDGNPLVQPSITAFEMGGPVHGLDQAMQLFEEWLNEKKAQAAANEGTLALLPLASERPVELKDAVTLSGTLLGDETSAAATAPGNEAKFLTETGEGEEMDKGKAYYFGHLPPGASEIAEMRNAETKLLMRKKCIYIDHQRKMAMAIPKGKHVPDHLKKFLGEKDKPFRIEQHTDKIPVTDLDLYFNLLVFSTRPLLSSCKGLFEKFHVQGLRSAREADAAMSQQEWNNLCNRVPVKLPQEVKDDMWNLLSSGPHPGVIAFFDFVAGWHIHDIEHQDAFIQRVAKVQNLDYYDMDVEEMQKRLKARAALEATLCLEFEAPEGEEKGKSQAQEHLLLPAMEGERRQARRLDRGGARASPGSARQANEEPARGPRISMSTAQYVEGDAPEDEAAEEALPEPIDSDALSRDEDSEISAFDAEEAIESMEKKEDELRAASAVDGTGEHGEALQMPFAYLDTASEPMTPLAFRSKGLPGVGKAKVKAALRGKKAAGPVMGKKDARFRTDVFQVRVALREAFRNIPYEDFKKLVNFLIRGLKRIVDFPTGVTYWHVDDPSFRYATGVVAMNSYAKKLMTAMGFVSIADKYWVWPEKHLSMGLDWAHEEVPPECPGLSPYRLHDMVSLMKECQKVLSTEGKSFRGHFL